MGTGHKKNLRNDESRRFFYREKRRLFCDDRAGPKDPAIDDWTHWKDALSDKFPECDDVACKKKCFHEVRRLFGDDRAGHFDFAIDDWTRWKDALGDDRTTGDDFGM